MEDTINQAITNFNCEQHTDILKTVYKDLGLSQYFNKAIEHYKATELSVPVEKLSKIALLYEGGAFMKLPYNEMQALMLYGLFVKKKQTFLNIHESIAVHHRIGEKTMKLLEEIIDKIVIKKSYDIANIINDHVEMFMYVDKDDFFPIECMIKGHSVAMNHTLSEKELIDVIFMKLQAYQWKSRWAKMKSFKRNYPQILKDIKIRYSEKMLDTA